MVRLICTDIGFKILKSHFGKMPSRSSFALRFTDVGVGVIYADYRGPVSVIFFNFSNRFLEIENGTRFAQTIFQKTVTLRLREVDKFVDKTQRDQSLLPHLA